VRGYALKKTNAPYSHGGCLTVMRLFLSARDALQP